MWKPEVDFLVLLIPGEFYNKSCPETRLRMTETLRPCRILKKGIASQVLFRIGLFNFYVLGKFSVIFLLLIPSLISLCSESRYQIISILLTFLRFVLWLRM